MSQENVEIVREAYRNANAAGGIGGILEYFAPDVEFHLAGAFPDLDAVYRGHEGVRQLADQMTEPWEQFTMEPDRFIDLDERVLVLSHFHGVGRGGIDVRLPFAHLWTIHEGRAVRMDAFSGHAEALEAVGLSE